VVVGPQNEIRGVLALAGGSPGPSWWLSGWANGGRLAWGGLPAAGAVHRDAATKLRANL